METRTRREIIRLVQRLGMRVVSIEDTRKAHIRCRVNHPDGRSAAFIFAGSPSDHRNMLNMEKEITRWAKQGLEDETKALS